MFRQGNENILSCFQIWKDDPINTILLLYENTTMDITMMLDDVIAKKIKIKQTKLIQRSNRAVTFLKVLDGDSMINSEDSIMGEKIFERFYCEF